MLAFFDSFLIACGVLLLIIAFLAKPILFWIALILLCLTIIVHCVRKFAADVKSLG